MVIFKMIETYLAVEKFSKQQGMNDILFFAPVFTTILKHETLPLGDLLLCGKKNRNFEGEFYEAFNGHHSDLELLNIAENIHFTSRLIIDNDKDNYKAIINIFELDKEIKNLIADNHLPSWKEKLSLEGYLPVYHLYLLETKALIEHYKRKNYHRYQILAFDDFVEVGCQVMKSFIQVNGKMENVHHALNYVVNQFLIKHRSLPKNGKYELENKLSHFLIETMVDELKKHS